MAIEQLVNTVSLRPEIYSGLSRVQPTYPEFKELSLLELVLEQNKIIQNTTYPPEMKGVAEILAAGSEPIPGLYFTRYGTIYTGQLSDLNEHFKINELREFVRLEFKAGRLYSRYLSLAEYEPACGVRTFFEEFLYGEARRVLVAYLKSDAALILAVKKDVPTISMYAPPHPFFKFEN